jgi:hypothetical protein
VRVDESDGHIDFLRKNFLALSLGDGDMVRMLILSRERKKGVSVTKHHVVPSGKTGTLAHLGRKEHLNWVILFPC